MALPNYAFFRGKIIPYAEAKIGVLSHALNYGTSVFGGMRGYWNNEEKQLFVFRPFDHFRRFLQSTSLLRMTLPYKEDDLTNALIELLNTEDQHEDVYIRPLAFYGDEMIGVKLHGLTPEVSIVAFPFGQYMKNNTGAHVTFSAWRRIDDNMIPARGKIGGAYINSAFIKTDAELSGFDEALVLTQEGHVSEGSAANFFIVRNGVAVTPPITDNILEGITRRTMITLLRDEIGMDVVERPIDRTEVYLADEAFFCGTGVQIAAITKVDHRNIGSGNIGPVVSDIRELYNNVVRGKVQKYRSWCAPVYTAEKIPA
jgi:branched-chain amino acid aminotransferase